jgi:hypothetical protein
MLNLHPVTKSLLNYKPLSVEKNIKRFLFAKKYQEIFGILFEGEFDNQIQTIVDRKISKIRTNWFRHEHIHCSVKRQNDLSKNFSLFQAFYYFPFKTPTLFRERMYLFFSSNLSTNKNVVFQMEILQNCNFNNFTSKKYPMEFKEIFFRNSIDEKILNQCKIFWILKISNDSEEKEDFFYSGELLNGGCSIFSFNTFKFLQVKDNLILSEHSLWVNDRGFSDQASIEYGNIKEIPYKLERLSSTNQLTVTKRQVKKKYN